MIPKNISEEMRKKIVGKGIDPAFMDKHRAALVRRHRQVIYLNDRELEAIDRYCGQYGVSSKSVLFREAVMEKVLSCLSDSHCHIPAEKSWNYEFFRLILQKLFVHNLCFDWLHPWYPR